MKLTSPQFDSAEIEQVKKCLDSGWVTQGPMVQQFEQLLAERHQAKYACATTSCTAALHLTMLSLGIGPEDEVVVPAFTWITSANCAEYVGANVKFADVDPNTYNLDPDAFEAAITQHTKAVVVVHLFGLAAEMDRIMAIANKHDIQVIEDAACAIGTTYKNIPIGGFGVAGCFSFHPRKIITTGEGGALITNNAEIASLANAYRCHGFSGYPTMDSTQLKPYTMGYFDYLGYNLRLSDIQAAVGVAQMAKLDMLLDERLHNALRYNKLLAEIDEIAIPYIPEKCTHTYQSYVIRIKKGGVVRRNFLMDHLLAKGVETRPGTHAVHRLGYYVKKYQISPHQFPNACMGEDETITLPLFPGMREDDQRFVVDNLKEAIRQRER